MVGRCGWIKEVVSAPAHSVYKLPRHFNQYSLLDGIGMFWVEQLKLNLSMSARDNRVLNLRSIYRNVKTSKSALQ